MFVLCDPSYLCVHCSLLHNIWLYILHKSVILSNPSSSKLLTSWGKKNIDRRKLRMFNKMLNFQLRNFKLCDKYPYFMHSLIDGGMWSVFPPCCHITSPRWTLMYFLEKMSRRSLQLHYFFWFLKGDFLLEITPQEKNFRD